MEEVFNKWAAEKLSFADLVRREAAAFGQAHSRNLWNAVKKMLAGGVSALSLDDLMSETNVLNTMLGHLFSEHGIPKDDHFKTSLRFFEWEGLMEVPSVRISAYLFAAIARKAAAGQRRPPSSGMINDVRLLSSYLPYVDAMFIDNECAALLAERPLTTDLSYRAQIFSLNTREQFIAYLDSLEKAAESAFVDGAREIYGI